jgi:hypothetical protein
MKPTGTDVAFAAVRGSDPAVMGRDELAGLVTQLRQVRSWCDTLEVRVARRTREVEVSGHSEPAASLLGDSGRVSGKDARNAAERETTCTALPCFEDALAGGRVSSGHVDAVSSSIRNLDEPTRAEFVALSAELLADAETQRVEVFERSCRDLARHLTAVSQAASDATELDAQHARSNVRRWVDTHTGMCHTHLELDPLRDAKLWAAIQTQQARLRQQDGNRRTPWAQLQCDALVTAVTAGGTTGVRVPEITVLIDEQSLRDRAHEHTVCETDAGVPLPISTVRRLCCDANIVPVVLNGAGETLDVGRSSRTATRAQRQALRAMHRSCVHPDCTVTFDACRIHHIKWWTEHNGPTDLDNLVPLCAQHHHDVHEGRWTLAMTSERYVTWTRPDGTKFHQGPTIHRTTRGVDEPLGDDSQELGLVLEACRHQPSSSSSLTLAL